MSDHEHYKKIERALERHHEAHFWLHGMESYYHQADPFRWHLNAFLKALHEVPDMLHMVLQNTAGFPKWFRPHKEALYRDPLVFRLGTLLSQTTCATGRRGRDLDHDVVDTRPYGCGRSACWD